MATANWHELYQSWYRRQEIYEMVWEFKYELPTSSSHFAAARFGGPIAIICGDERVRGRPTLQMFTSCGTLLTSFSWNHQDLIQMEWSDNNTLVCVLRDGTVCLYSIHGETVAQFTLGKECKTYGVEECFIWGSGLVVRTAISNDLVAICNFEEPQRVALASFELQHKVICMTAISPQQSQSNHLEVLLATSEGSVIIVNEVQAEDQLLTHGPFTLMSVSVSGRRLACLNAQGTLYCVSSDFKRSFCELQLQNQHQPQVSPIPHDVCWCADDAIVLVWPTFVLLAGAHGHFIRFPYDNVARVCAEADGVRMVTVFSSEWIQKVPKATEHVFRIGSVEPAALLYDAAEAAERKRALKSDELVRTICQATAMPIAVNECLEAAAREVEGKNQKRLLKAASFGALFLDEISFDYSAISAVCRCVRVLNAVRSMEFGMALTYDQYLKLTPHTLIDRLVDNNHHALCLQLCEYLSLPPNKVLVHWACRKATCAEDLDDKVVAADIVCRLRNVAHISFAEVASAAYRAHRVTLAVALLEHEPRSSQQVPLLISMNEDEIALNKAIESGDTDLVYLVLLHIKRNRSKTNLFRLIQKRPMAASLLIEYCKHEDIDLLKNCYYFLQKPRLAAHLAVSEAYKRKLLADRIRGLELALQFYRDDRSDSLAAKMTSDEIRLLKLQSKQEIESIQRGEEFLPWVDLSVSDMIDRFLSAKQIAKASKAQQLFKVPPKRFWHIQVQVYARNQQWNQLYALVSKKKRPPIGYQPFIDACVKARNEDEAVRYVLLLPNNDEQLEQLAALNRWETAAQIAIRSHNSNALRTIANFCSDENVQHLVKQALKAQP